jgi:hypothetical protein
MKNLQDNYIILSSEKLMYLITIRIYLHFLMIDAIDKKNI